MNSIQITTQTTALTVLGTFGRAVLGTLDHIFQEDPRSPQALRISRWTYFEDREREALYAGLELDRYGLHHLPLHALGAPDENGKVTLVGRDTLAKLSLAVNGRPVYAVRDNGFWYLVQLKAPRLVAPAPRVTLPMSVKLDLTHPPERALSIPFGVTGTGSQLLDLAQPNHLLIAGTTQTGKSSWIQAALVTLCSFNTPEQIRLVIVDPKGEFVHWHNTPHLYAPIAAESQSAMRLINDVVADMDRRRKLFEAATARNLTQYQIRTGQHLPLLVVVIDEFVDLALEIGRAYIPVLMRLVNKAASYGIRLILATQSPKAEIVDSALRQQCSIRLSFRCTDVWQSEAVLGQGKRDAARLPNIPGRFVAQLPGASELIEGQAYYVDDDLLDAVTDRLRAATSPQTLDAAQGQAALIVLTDDQRDMLRWALNECDGYFKLRELSREFYGTLTAPQSLRDLAQQWEAAGWLHKPARANASRLIGSELRKAVGWV